MGGGVVVVMLFAVVVDVIVGVLESNIVRRAEVRSRGWCFYLLMF